MLRLGKSAVPNSTSQEDRRALYTAVYAAAFIQYRFGGTSASKAHSCAKVDAEIACQLWDEEP